MKKNITKVLNNRLLCKQLISKIISDLMEEEYEIIYNNIYLSSNKILFLYLNDDIKNDNTYYFNIKFNLGNTNQIYSFVYELYLNNLHNDKIKKINQIEIDEFDLLNKNEFKYYLSLMEEKYYVKINSNIKVIHLNLNYLRNLNYKKIKNNNLMRDLYFLVN